ncbi:preprotein translocase subunit SecF [[Haemophilus] ducreyi]|uniref:Protein-export membrane protein SecF n=2 Tax=Haemophilus ducreyi TaxID=730 RepID=Q7VKV9_HAEDU|nr:protein translocase subunit SecF [[Haemophilus] ducreyi]AAP96508.1 protein-export membrane protein SecF [[Haemophilus] ducreyi 35000HP]AKO31365.1 preprotein translocase subunit SecF [[Haemophilus] ducreyi]AKO32816.1 preprotein translocase subunit SecF [[Haemophilus] ducreyi]AKO34265.1 preprotein translocase subunit SecF [[Haemophilus] ducreyi]AKO35708.1 preprotein translocase subunit SecF [[Haemophilus] ducreyi]
MSAIQQEKDMSDIKLPYKLIPFMKYRYFGFLFSFIVTGLCIFSIVTKGFNWGLDFTGGTVIETTFSQPANLAEIRTLLKQNGYESALVQTTGSQKELMIRLPASAGDMSLGNKIMDLVHRDLDANAIIKSVEFVGPNVGEELTQGAIWATLATLGMLLLYVGTRFEIRLAIGGILALFHDVLVTVGLFSFLQIEIDLTFVAAILSVVGYSLNDSIVVFDRVRENFSKIRRVTSIEIIDISLSQTLSRTLMTSITTLFVVLALFLFGGPTIHSFSLALLIGIGFGTYSSIYVAIGVALQLGLDREHMIKPVVEKEGADQQSFIDY